MGHKLSKIYTRTGDQGTTSLDGKTRIEKYDLRVEALGTIDELNCVIGILFNFVEDAVIQQKLTTIQHLLFDLGGELCPPHRPAITSDHVLQLEKMIDEWNVHLPPLTEFILPQGDLATTHCHLARAICRRAERLLFALHAKETVSNEILIFMNRLSDMLFVLARVLNSRDEKLWEPHTY